MKKSNIVCFIISLILLYFGIGGIKGAVTLIFSLNDELSKVIAFFPAILWLVFSGGLLIGGIALTIITIQLASTRDYSSEEEENVIKEIPTKSTNSVRWIECILYIAWIIIAFI